MSVADSRIKVAVRVRPLVNGEINSKIQVDSAKNQVRVSDLAKSYSFDYVMDSNASQQAVYSQCGVDKLVDKAIQGYNATLFAYGSTGSGKTYTIEGNNNNINPKEQKQGLVARTVHSLFDKLSKLKDNNYTVQCSFLQIYNEKIYDLLNPVSAKQSNAATHNQLQNISANTTIYNNTSHNHNNNHNNSVLPLGNQDVNKVDDMFQKIDEKIEQTGNEMSEHNENTVVQQETVTSNKQESLSQLNQAPDTMENTRCESNNSNNRSNSKSKHEWGYSSRYSKLSTNGKTQNQFLSQTNYNNSSPNHNNFSNSFNNPFMDSSIQGPGLRLRWSAREQFQVENLFVFECKSAAELLSYFQAGQKNRVTASHKINIQSSRSHSMLTIRVEQSGGRIAGRIQLVDLAGSERVGQTGAEGRLAKEGIDINKSLFALRQVINTLTDTQHATTHVPYRESKLTALLKQSIGGSSFCLMIACVNVNDTSYEDTLSTLNYASKAAKIHNQPKRDIDYRDEQIKQLQRENEQLQIELDSANQHIKLITLLQSKQKMSNNAEDVSDITHRLAEIGEQQSIQSQQLSIKKDDNDPKEKEEKEQELIHSYLNNETINQNSILLASSKSAINNCQVTCSNLKECQNSNPTASAAGVPVTVDEEYMRTQFSLVAETIRTISVTQEQQQQFERAACLLQALSSEQESLLRQIQQLKQINREYASQLQQSQMLLQESQNTIVALQETQGQGDSQQDRKIVREYEQFSDRLIESIRMVRQLLINNKSLRESTDLAMSKNQTYLQEIGYLEKENQSLREMLLIARREHSSTLPDLLINSIDSLSNCDGQDKQKQGKNTSSTKRNTCRSSSRQSGKTEERRNQGNRNTDASSRDREYKQARSVSGQFIQDNKNNAFEQQSQLQQFQQYLNSQSINSKLNHRNDQQQGVTILNAMSTLFQPTLDQSLTIKSPTHNNLSMLTNSMLFTSNRRVSIEEDNQLILDLDSSSQPIEAIKRFKNRCAVSSLNKSNNASASLTAQEVDTSFYDRKLQSSGNIQISSSTRRSFASEKKTPTKQRRQSNQRDSLSSAKSNYDQQDQNSANMDNLKLCQDSQPTHFCKNILSAKKSKINNDNDFGNEQENQQQQQYSQHPSILPPVFQLNNVTPTKQPMKKKQALAQSNQTDDLACSPNINHLQNRSAKLVACYGQQLSGNKRISNKSPKSNNPLIL